jgi:hypothetical protein
MKKFLRNIFFGNIPVTEYSTVTVEGDIHERVYLDAGGAVKDISTIHWLLCLNPLVFGIWFVKKEDIVSPDDRKAYSMYFKDSEKEADTVAVLKLDYFDKIEEQDGTLLLLKLSDTSIHHINAIRTRLIFHKYYKKPEQDFKRLKSYAAAYSYPRRVRIISFKEGSWYNIFPMDLVGDIPLSRRYVFGLRHSNVTLARIIETKKMVVSEVPHQYKDVIYQLGKHHREPLSGASLPFGLIQSEIYDFPIPAFANSYKEIRILKTMNLGSHMLLWGEEINEKYISEPHGHLFHIHFLHYLHQKKKGLAYALANQNPPVTGK